MLNKCVKDLSCSSALTPLTQQGAFQPVEHPNPSPRELGSFL